MTEKMERKVESSISELCKQALEHYLKLSDAACDYNSLIPKAIEFYRKMHAGSFKEIDQYYEDLEES